MDNQDGGQASSAASIRQHIQDDPSFREFQDGHPLVAALVLAFFGRADDALAAIRSGDVATAQKLASEMGEVYSWLKNASPPLVDSETSSIWATMVRLGVPMEDANRVFQGHFKKGKGKPVTNRSRALLALEQKRLNPKQSWMDLVNKLCLCGRRRHGPTCRASLIQQARELRKVMVRLGV